MGRDFEVDSPLAKAYHGSGIMNAVGSVPGREAYFKFEESMQQLSESKVDMEFLSSNFPTNYPDGKTVDHSLVTDHDSFLKKLGIVAPFTFGQLLSLAYFFD